MRPTRKRVCNYGYSGNITCELTNRNSWAEARLRISRGLKMKDRRATRIKYERYKSSRDWIWEIEEKPVTHVTIAQVLTYELCCGGKWSEMLLLNAAHIVNYSIKAEYLISIQNTLVNLSRSFRIRVFQAKFYGMIMSQTQRDWLPIPILWWNTVRGRNGTYMRLLRVSTTDFP